MILKAKITVRAVVPPEDEEFYRSKSPVEQAEIMQSQVKMLTELLESECPEGSEITVTVEEETE